MLLTKREPDEPIITDMADLDWYANTMKYAFMTQEPELKGTLVLIDRDNRIFPKGFNERFRQQLKLLAEATLSPEAEAHMRATADYMPEWFYDYLRHFRINPDMIYSHQDGDGYMHVQVHGYLYDIVSYETPIMAIMSELVNDIEGTTVDPDFEENVYQKARRLADLGAKFAEMDTRRRPNKQVQRLSLHAIKNGSGGYLKGTSNAALAAELGIALIGTMGHIFPQAHMVYGIRSANRMAMINWDNAFQGILGTMIVDTFTTPKFLEDFTPHFANLFRGTREDSGSSLQHIDWMVNHYRSMNIDPLTKEVTFTNSLNDVKVASIKAYDVESKLRDYYGIGGWFSAGLGLIKLNIVMKLWDVTRPQEPNRKIYVVKIPNEIGKQSGDPRAIEAGLYELGIERDSLSI
ncbi:MAG: hypothetical protein HZC02_01065 [Candidatus Levybacteria bacterium]|nr:hypothetical protein [Candidatus Levybacteria bacterium]